MSAEQAPGINVCKTQGCHAACCRGSYFSSSCPVEKVLEWFPNALKVGQFELPELRMRGVYYEVSDFGARVRIVGNCPNLGPEDNCQIYEKRPPACANVAKDSEICFASRPPQTPAITH